MTQPIIGQTVILQVTFRDTDGNLVDPTTVDLTIVDPEDAVTTPAPDNPSVGIYQYSLDLTLAGDWDYRWEGDTTEGTAVFEGRVCAIASTVL